MQPWWLLKALLLIHAYFFVRLKFVEQPTDSLYTTAALSILLVLPHLTQHSVVVCTDQIVKAYGVNHFESGDIPDLECRLCSWSLCCSMYAVHCSHSAISLSIYMERQSKNQFTQMPSLQIFIVHVTGRDLGNMQLLPCEPVDNTHLKC